MLRRSGLTTHHKEEQAVDSAHREDEARGGVEHPRAIRKR